MKKAEYEKYLESDDWKRLRRDKIAQSNGICEKCKHLLGSAVPHCHHNSYDNLGHEDPDDIDAIHAHCHRREHRIKKEEKIKVND